ncbi:MAG: diacylglycerol kinase family protein [Bacteroidota bacterium]|nr:diacylglycerol kinase family protein [Bacteroidota bacterium]
MKQRQSFGRALINAFAGLRYFFQNERNAKIQAIIAIVTLLVALILKISIAEWIAIFLCIASVLCLEMINSALEALCDAGYPTHNDFIKICKDIAAGAVLLASIISVVIGLLIFIPKITG